VIRIPEDIRKHKERLVLGLNLRQLLAVCITLAVCAPLYFFGRGFMSEDILSWLVIIIGLPLLSIGFIRVNGLPMEKFIVSYFTFEFLYPRKRKFAAVNQWRALHDKAIAFDGPNTSKERREKRASDYQASLERTALYEEAAENGNLAFDMQAAPLLTVSTGGGGKKPGKKPDKKKGRGRASPNDAEAAKATEIKAKMDADPCYVISSKEARLLKAYSSRLVEARKKELSGRKDITKEKNNKMLKRRVARSAIPRSTQQTIPYIADHGEGMFEITTNKYSKLYKLKDVNYSTSKEQERENIFSKLGEFYNYFGEGMTFAITVDNRYISQREQEHKVFCSLVGDENDKHREEHNRVLREQIEMGRNDMRVDKYLTITIDSVTPLEALYRFRKIDAEIRDYLRRVGSDAIALDSAERLAYYHDKFRRGYEGRFAVDFEFLQAQGLSSKDYIAPSYFHFDKKHFMIDDDYYRVLYLTNLPKALGDDFLCSLCDVEFAVTVTTTSIPMAQDKALKFVLRRLTGIEMNKLEAEKKMVKQGLPPTSIRPDLVDRYERAIELKNDIVQKDQRLFFTSTLVMVHASTLEELENNCRVVEGKAGTVAAQLRILSAQQEDAMKMCIPFGHISKNIMVDTTLTTESLTVFMPFKNQELFHAGGFFYGLNQISWNLIVLDRTAMKTPSGFVLGTSGAGKSFATKNEILNVFLAAPDTGILIIDPENEYGDFCRAFGGTVIKLSADSNNYISPMDMTENYGLDDDDDPFDTPIQTKIDKAWRKKSDFIMSIIERMIWQGGSADQSQITPQQKTIVDRCVRLCYKEFFDSGFNQELLPTLLDLQNELDKCRGTEDGRMVAEGVEYYTRGSMSLFANKTNVRIDNRMVVFNVRDLGDQLRQIALTIVFDFIWNRMVENKSKGVRTYSYCDEIHLMFRSYYTADFLKQLYKRGRKYGLCITGLTQNVGDLLSSEMGRGMVGNSDYIMMLNQHSEDLKLLTEMLGISQEQMKYVVGADVGSGLLFAENVIVPFRNRFPNSSYLYRLMSTKFGEDMSSDEIDAQIRSIVDGANSRKPQPGAPNA